jgi:hypothetical protein
MPSEYVTLDSPLTLDSPDLCRRMETYWANVESTGGFEPSLPKAKHPLREFFEHEGIIDESSYPSDGMIQSSIGPIGDGQDAIARWAPSTKQPDQLSVSQAVG